MPKQYEAMRDKFASEGMSYDDAQAKAAAIYNAKHKDSPVGAKEHPKPPSSKLTVKKMFRKGKKK